MQERLYYISELIEKQLNDNLSAGETVELNKWLNSSDVNKKLYDQLHDEEFVKEQLEKFHRYDAEKNRAYLLKKLEESVSGESLVVSMKPKLWKRIAVAASIVGVLLVAGYWLMNNKTTNDGPQTTVIQTNDVKAPDKNRAQIKLADGSIVYLDSAGNGTLATQGNVNVVKTVDGEIEYSREVGAESRGMQYNTLYNPRGSIVQVLTLSDGTKVWLNSESSIKYPTSFNSSQRKVEITGEAYFEVMHDAGKKFIVVSNAVNTEVLGTHFNINSYSDEGSIKVTLLEGSIRVINDVSPSGQTDVLLKPGQQAQVAGGIKVSSNVDVQQVMAWKNGMFVFDNADIKTVMRQFARWYDVNVVYSGEVKETFYLKASRNTSLVNMFKVLERTRGVKLSVEGKTITVKP